VTAATAATALGLIFFAIFVEANPRWRSTITSAADRSYPHYVSVDSTRDTVVNLDIEFGKDIFGVN